MTDLNNQVALVTGASRGIGSAIAEQLGRAGAYVIGTATSIEGAKSITTKLNDQGLKATGMVLNIACTDSVADFAEQLKELESPTILVNNAGIIRDKLLMRMKADEWDEVVNTNLNGMYRITKLVVPSMVKARYGRIINISSVVGLSGNIGQTNYAATKAGMIGFTRSLAQELGSRQITVNAVAPGFIETDMTNNQTDEVRSAIIKTIPLARLGSADEVANVVKFLASSHASYITGETINVNGGIYMT